MDFADKMHLFEKIWGPSVKGWEKAHGELAVTVSPDHITGILHTLKTHESFACVQLMDVCAVDYLGKRETRFDVVYNLLSLVHNQRLRVKVPLEDGQDIASVTSVFVCADWWEREAFDMYGIIFKGHPDLRRILTDYGFEGFPLRKDFPLTGHVEVRYDPEQRKVVSGPVNLPQAFRTFDAVSPWKGMGGLEEPFAPCDVEQKGD
jgi:NADH-quinone oxidoreductase subunit C